MARLEADAATGISFLRSRAENILIWKRTILEALVHVATYADAAIGALEKTDDFQLVITDINMPGAMDGLRLAAAIRERWPAIHLVVVTGFIPPKRSELPLGSLFVPKPYGPRNILTAVALSNSGNYVLVFLVKCLAEKLRNSLGCTPFD